MLRIENTDKRVASSPLGLALIFLALSISSIVQIQPAPYDGLMIILILSFFTLGLRIPAKITVPAVFLGLFILANIISSLVIPEPGFNFIKPGHSLLALPTRIYLVLTWLFFVSAIYEDPDRVLDVIWKGYIVAAIIAVTFGLLVHYKIIHATGIWAEEWRHHGRIKATFEDANVFGPFLVVATIYMMSRLENATPVQMLVRLVLFGCFSWAVLLAYSRGAWGNYVASMGIYLAMRFYTARTRTRQLKIIVLGLSIILAVSGTLAGFIVSGKIEKLFFQRAQILQPYDVREGGRFDTQYHAIQHIATDPVGVGAGQAWFKLGLSPHNLYLIVPLETGWLGGIGLFGFILLTLWRGFRFCLKPTRFQHVYTVVFACTLATMLESVVIDTTHWRHMYLLWALVWGPILAWEKNPSQKLSTTACEDSKLTDTTSARMPE